MNPDENKHQFATRIVVTEDRPMNAKAIHDCVDERSVDMTMEEMQAHVCYAVKLQNLDKTRVVKNHETGGTHVVYHPLGQHPIGDEIPQPLFNKKKHLRPVIDFKGEDITPDLNTTHTSARIGCTTNIGAIADSLKEKGVAPILHKKGAMDNFDPDAFVVKRTPIIKPSGVPSNILDVLSVYHGKTVEQIEDIIMSKIRTARVDNKTLKHTSLFTVLKELVG